MTQGYIFSTTAFIAALIICVVMGVAWLVGKAIGACRAVDRRIDKILEGCL